jgi:hypothetical protein
MRRPFPTRRLCIAHVTPTVIAALHAFEMSAFVRKLIHSARMSRVRVIFQNILAGDA